MDEADIVPYQVRDNTNHVDHVAVTHSTLPFVGRTSRIVSTLHIAIPDNEHIIPFFERR